MAPLNTSLPTTLDILNSIKENANTLYLPTEYEFYFYYTVLLRGRVEDITIAPLNTMKPIADLYPPILNGLPGHSKGLFYYHYVYGLRYKQKVVNTIPTTIMYTTNGVF